MSDKRDYMEESRAAGIAVELTLTEEQVKRYVEVVIVTAKKRALALREDFHDIDFAMGAAVVLFATGNHDKVPPAWIYNGMRGVPIFTKEPTKEPEPTSGEGSGE